MDPPNWSQPIEKDWNVSSVNTIQIPINRKLEMDLAQYGEEMYIPIKN
jgi:hypothetical protein